MDVASPQPEPGRRRPFALLILIGLMLFKGVLIVVMVLGAVALSDLGLVRALRIEPIALAVRGSTAAVVLLFVLAATLFVSAIALLAYRRSGWLLAMVTTGVFVAVDIMGYVEGTANYFWMALNIVTVFYLNQREVRDSVTAASAPGSEAAQPGGRQ
ncbi:MAG TPA: hypothetical protein VGK16_16060 [Candidatus Limnocylindrales bacterium]